MFNNNDIKNLNDSFMSYSQNSNIILLQGATIDDFSIDKLNRVGVASCIPFKSNIALPISADKFGLLLSRSIESESDSKAG